MICKNQYQILQDLCVSNLPSRALLFIRHAERHPIARAGEGHDVSLTENGILMAIELGRMVPQQYRLFLSNTGIKRTIQTCEAIATGFQEVAGRVQIIGQVRSACDSYVVNEQELFAVANVLEKKFIPHWIQGKISPSLIELPEQAAWRLIKRLLDPAAATANYPKKMSFIFTLLMTGMSMS